MIGGVLTRFYQGPRWPGWESEVAGGGLDQGINALPPPWTIEGGDLSTVSRKAIPVAELVSVQQASASQFRPGR